MRSGNAKKKTNSRRKRSPRAARPRIQFLIEEPRWRAEVSALRLMRRALRLVLEELPQAGGGKSARGIAVLLGNDAKLRALNLGFRRRDKATNVLSFPAGAGDSGHLGDIALAFGMVKKEAREQGKDFAAHAAHLAAHGALHLLGYDHAKKTDARRMEGLETRLLGRIRVSDPYAPRLYTRAGRPA
jgi:probable rRNA maturation factor